MRLRRSTYAEAMMREMPDYTPEEILWAASRGHVSIGTPILARRAARNDAIAQAQIDQARWSRHMVFAAWFAGGVAMAALIVALWPHIFH